MRQFQKTIKITRKNGEEQEFVLRRCDEEDLHDIMHLQSKIFHEVSDPGIYSVVRAEDIIESLKKDYCYGVYLEDQLVAFTMMISNRVSSRNYGSYLGYPPKRQEKCVSLEISIVDEPCRGFGIQRYFVVLREDIARRKGATEALVTIGPSNEHSLNNLIMSGYKIIDTRPLYEGAMRHILQKYL